MSDAGTKPVFTVQRLRGGFALVFERDGKRSRRQLAATDRQSAEAEARALWRDSERGAWTVGRVMAGYMDTLEGKPSLSRRRDAWKAMKNYWENVDPATIDEAMVKAYRTRRSAANSTIRYELLQLSTALGWATDNGPKLSKRPKVWLPPVADTKLRHLSKTEFRKFFSEVRADHDRLYVLLGLFTMARPSALLQLTWDRVDFMRRRIDFTPPGHIPTAKRRTIVPIADELLPWLQKAHAARTIEHVVVRGGEPIPNIKKAFQAASQRSAVHATPYTLRHTRAVWAAEAGIPMSELAQFMGHDDDRMTSKHYARYSPDYLAAVANAISLKA